MARNPIMSNLSQKQFLLLFILLLLFGAGWIVASRPLAGSLEKAQSAPSKGFLAPDFTLSTLAGESITLSDLRGEAVLVNLWASWCVPCRTEMPAMQRVYERYRDEGFTILAVNVTNQDNLPAVQAFVDEFGLSYPILLDVDGSVSSMYQLRAFPTSYFIGRDGRIQEVVIGGPMAEALLTIRAEQLLAGQP